MTGNFHQPIHMSNTADPLTPEAVLATFNAANRFYARMVLGIEPERNYERERVLEVRRMMPKQDDLPLPGAETFTAQAETAGETAKQNTGSSSTKLSPQTAI